MASNLKRREPGAVLLGRDEEQVALDDLLAAVGEGYGRALVLHGAAGMGKTRLLEHTVARAPSLVTAWITGVEAEQDLGFAALHRLLRPFLGNREDLPRPQRDALGSAFGLELDAPADRFLVGLASLTLLAEIADTQGLLVVVDDAQWIDTESLAALGFVGRRLVADRMALLFGVRDDDGIPDALIGLPSIEVGGLSDDAARALLSGQAGAPVDDDTAYRIISATNGCPLAILELAIELSNDQLPGGGRTLIEPLPIGRTLEEHYLRQVRALGEPTQLFLLVAAAETSSDPALVRRVADELGAGGAAEDAAIASGLLVVDPDVAFRHPLIRSAIYGGAPTDLRSSVHTTIAAHIDRDAEPDRRAWHLAAAARGDDDDLADELEALARRAGQRGGNSAESALLAQSAQLTSDPRLRSERLLRAAMAAFNAGLHQRTQALLDQCRPGLGDPALRAEAMRLDALFNARRGNNRAVPGMLLAAAREYATVDRARARSMLLDAMHTALVSQHLTDGTSVEEIARTALALPPTDPASATLADHLLDATSTLIVSGYDVAAPSLRQALAVLQRDESTPSDSDLYVGVTITNELWDDEAQGHWCRRVEASARDRGSLVPLMAALTASARYHTRVGNFDQAEAHLAEAAGIPVAMGGRPGILEQLACDRHAWRGQASETVATAGALIAIGEAAGNGNFEQIAQMALATLAMGEGRYSEALDAVRPILDAGAPGIACQVLALGVAAGVRTGDGAVVAHCLGQLEQRAVVAGTPWALGQLALCRALTATTSTDADDLYRTAITHLTATAVATDLAHAHLLYGEWLRRENRRRDARSELRLAEEAFSTMGAEGFARRARVELAATGEKVRRRSVETASDLTPQEVQVARMAAEGATNSEIGARLFISSSTVDYHLRKVFRKVGVSSRRQLRSVDLRTGTSAGPEVGDTGPP